MAGSTFASAWPWHLEATGPMREHRDHVDDLVGGFGEGYRGILAMARRRCGDHGDGAAGRDSLGLAPQDGLAVLSKVAAATGGAAVTLPLGAASHNRRHYAARFSWVASQARSNCMGLT